MKKIIAILASTTVLAACQQGGGTYNENPNTYKGAAAGAAIGGIAGALADDDNRLDHAAIGAAAGALAGGAYGQYMDQQERELRQVTQGTGVQVSRQGNDLFLNMPNSITFAYDSSNIQPGFKPTLNNIAGVLQSYSNTMVEIYGHTDSTGSNSYNQSLSERRAESVASYLRNAGVSQPMMTNGLGETQPIASNDTEAGRAQNRRVEIKISPIAK